MSQFLSSNELFINIKNPPQWNPRKSYYEQDIDVLDFYLEEKRKITEGITIGGYYIHPWLYWHMNFFKTPIPTKNKQEVIMNPPLDDNFLYVVESYQEAEAKALGLALFGARGVIKSTLLTSLTTWLNTSKPNGTTSIVGGSDPDLKAISSLMQTAFNNIHPAMFVPQLISNWDSRVQLGIKEKDGFKMPYSNVSIVNAAKGSDKESEKGAGLSPVGWIGDEFGKYAIKKILQSALPSFKTPYGAKLVHVLAGTSGNKELSKDAKDILSDPAAYDLLMTNWDRLDRNVPEEAITWERSKKDSFSIFMPGQMSYRLPVPKVPQSLGDYLNMSDEQLNNININVTDWINASKFIQDKNASFKKLEDQEKNRMYYPLEIADIFLTESANPFPTAVIDRHIRRLEDEGKTGKDIDIFKNAEGKNKAEFVNKKRAAVSHGGGEADAPIILFGELPEFPPARHIFVSGLDDYKLDLSDTDSLGAFYVIKRRNLEPNQPCETIAASYVARPYNHRDLHSTCEKMIETWDAECNMESADISFVQHLDLKGKAMKLLTPAFSFATTISNTNSKLNSRYGVYPTTANKAYMFNLLIDFCKEEHVLDIDDDGNQIIKYGVEFIDDIDLLKEMMSFKKGGNFDRITAFMHAIALARELDKKGISPIDRRHDQIRKDQMRNRPKTQRTVFSKNSNRKVF